MLRSMDRTLSHFRIAGSALLFASVALAASAAPADIPAVAWAEVRLLGGGMLLALVVGSGRVLAALRTRGRGRLAVAALAMALFQWTFFAAAERAGPVYAALLSTAAAQLAARLLERGAGGAATLLAAALLGTACAISPPGIILSLASGACYAAYTVAASRDAGLAATCAALIASGLALLPLAFGAPVAALLSPGGLAIGAYVAVGGTTLAYWLYATGLRRVSPAAALAIQLVQPLATLAAAMAFPGARIDRFAFAAAFLCVASSAALFIPTLTTKE